MQASLDVSCYTNSQVALYWVHGKDKEWKPFVENRWKEIRRNVHPDLWHHCPGITNPADLPSRGLTPMELSVSQLWRVEPEWLGLDSPVQSDIESLPTPELCSQELKSTSKSSLAVEKKSTIGDLMPCEDFSDLQRLLRVTAYVLRAVDCFKAERNSGSNPPDKLTPKEIAAAKLLWTS